MKALQKIQQAGFHLTINGDKLVIEPASKLTPGQVDFLKSNKAEIINDLLAHKKAYQSAKASILNWLESIGEDDKDVIADVLTRCLDDHEALKYFVGRACRE